MAVGIENYTNIDTTDPTKYPEGQIRNNNGSGNGTPVNTETYGDLHQFFAALLRIAGIAASGTPENATNGYQYLLAAKKILANRYGAIYTHNGAAPFSVPSTENALVIVTDVSSPGTFTLEESTSSPYNNLDTVKLINKHSGSIVIDPEGSDTIDGVAGGYNILVGNKVELTLDKANANWIVTSIEA